jgi:hypothetical protein
MTMYHKDPNVNSFCVGVVTTLNGVARSGALDVLLERLQARQARRVVLEGELAAQRAHVPYGSADGLERRLRAKLADWRGGC